MDLEHTLALIKPEGMPHQKKIIARLLKEGFQILNKRTVHLTPEQVSDFYQDKYGRLDFPLLVASTSASPVTALLLGRPGAIEKLKELAGPYDVNVAKAECPDSFNSEYGNANCNLAAVHASADVADANREVHFFFPQSLVEPLLLVQQNADWLEQHVIPLLKKGLAQVLKEKPTEPLLWLAGWLLRNNPNTPTTLEHLRHQHFSED